MTQNNLKKNTTIKQDKEEIKDEPYEPKLCSSQEFLKPYTKEELTEELKERATIERMQQNVDKVVVEYFKRHGTTYIVNGAVFCSSAHGPRTLEECIELFKNCNPAIIDELISLYAIIEHKKEEDMRREGYSSACRTFRPVNYTK